MPDGSQQTNESYLQADATQTEKQLVGWATDQYRRIKNARRSIERQWYVNLAFYFGKQNIAVAYTNASSTGFRLHVPKAPPWRVRLVINKIRPIVRTEIAKVVAQRPRFYVVPASTEDQDQSAARVGEQVFDSVYSGKKVKITIRQAVWWSTITGTSFIKNYWDPNTKDSEGNPGDFCFERVTPFHLFVPDFDEEDIEKQPFVIHATTKSVDWVRSTFPNLKAEPNVNAANDLLDDSFMGMIGAQSPDAKNAVLCLEVWIKPGGHKNFPEGGMFTVIGDRMVQIKKPYPYSKGEYPFAKLESIPSGKFYATSVIEDLLPLQREYNRTRSQIIENKNRMSKLQLMAPKGSVDAQKISSEPGQVIFYTPGFQPPQPLPLQNLPPYVLQEIQNLQQDMDDISGQHEISRGQNPAQVTAATALSYLQEQDDTKLSGTIEVLEAAVEKLGRLTLGFVSQFWSEERLIKVVGRDGTFDAHVFKGSDLRGNNDVRVEAGSALPTSKAAKQAFLMDLIKLGAIPIQDALQVLDIGGIEKVYEDYLVDVRQAQRENLKLSAGAEELPNEFDNHQVHITIHDKFRKSQQFEALDEQAKVNFQTHVQLHRAIMASQMPPPVDANGQISATPPSGQPDNANPGQPPMQPDTMDVPQPPMPGGM